SHDGAGVTKVNGYTLFVHGALPEEKATIKVVKTKKHYGFGKLLKVLDESSDRIEAPCPIYHQCGGCQVQHFSYAGQLRQKQQRVQEELARIGGLTGVPVHPVMSMENPWYYRNKAQVPVGKQRGATVIGFYQRGSHRIVPMDHCMIQDEVNDATLQTVKAIVDEAVM